MKHILFFLFLTSQAMSQTITKSFVLGTDGVNYYEVIRSTDDNGNYTETAALVGPAPALAADQADKIEAKMTDLANAAFAVSYAGKRITEQKAFDATITTLTGISPLALIQARHATFLLTPGWTIDPGTGFVSLVFTINAQGALRYSVNGAATKQANVYGNVIRLNNYPATGTDTDFFRNEDGGRYFSLPNRAIVIKKP